MLVFQLNNFTITSVQESLLASLRSVKNSEVDFLETSYLYHKLNTKSFPDDLKLDEEGLSSHKIFVFKLVIGHIKGKP